MLSRKKEIINLEKLTDEEIVQLLEESDVEVEFSDEEIEEEILKNSNERKLHYY